WALHVAAGDPWLGRTVRKGSALYFVGEGTSGFRRRIVAAELGRWESVPSFHWYADPLNLSGTADAGRFLSEARALKPALVVVDTLSCFRGRAEENSATEMAPVLRVLSRACADVGCAVVAVHHPTKMDKEVIRGSGAILGTTDAAIFCEGDGA